jgi:peroxiredoxin
MKNRILAALAVASLLLASQSGLTQEKSAAATELKELMTKVSAKMKEGPPTENDLADELKEFDTLLARHKGEKTDDVAQILFMKAQLYLQVFDNSEKGTELINQLKRDFPETKQGKSADKVLESIEKQAAAKKIRDSLVVGTVFPDFDEKDVTGKPLSIANYKGKVVLIDFWATWCGPCVAELPNVLKAYEKHHAEGFEIIGISLDKDKAKLESFTKEKNMPWQQFFDGLFWNNKLSTKYGVNSIPATYLLDGEGKIIGKNLRGEALEAAVAKALGKS